MKSFLTSMAAAIVCLATVVTVAPAHVSAGARDCASWGGELLPGSSACLAYLDLALRPGGYVFRFESDTPDSESYRDIVATVAGELSDITSLPFTIGQDLPAGTPPDVGEIVVRLHQDTARCRGSSACASGYEFNRWPWTIAGDQIQGGQIYLTTKVDGDSPATRKAVVMHEIGHVLGLHHYDYLGDAQPTHEIMAWNVRNTSVVEWQSGDLAGLRYLADYQRRSPTGAISTVVVTATGVIIKGEMNDPSSPANQSILVSIDGSAAIPGAMNGWFKSGPGDHQVCITLINEGAGVDTDLGCHDVTVPGGAEWWVLAPLTVEATQG